MKRALVLLLLVAGCRAGNDQLPDGSYAGSTAEKQAITVDVSGSQVRVNGHSTDRTSGGGFRDTKKPHTLVKCKTEPEHELSCIVTVSGHSETVELMRL